MNKRGHKTGTIEVVSKALQEVGPMTLAEMMDYTGFTKPTCWQKQIIMLDWRRTMALGDYILCCKCEVKLIYDGDRGQREWWEERFGKPPEIECPDCKAPASKPWVGLTQEERDHIWNTVGNSDAHGDVDGYSGRDVMAAIEAKLREKNA